MTGWMNSVSDGVHHTKGTTKYWNPEERSSFDDQLQNATPRVLLLD